MSTPSLRGRVMRAVLLRTKNSAPLGATIDREARAERDERPPVALPALISKRARVQVESVGATTVVRVAPKSGSSSRLVVLVHGGGYVENASIATWRLALRLVRRLDAEVWVPLYRLAPRATASETVPSIVAVLRAAMAPHGAERTSVVGDSAGGGLALAAVQVLVAQGEVLPRMLGLIAPWVDLRMARARERSRDDPMLDPDRLRAAAAAYAGALPLEHPFVSPVLGALSGLPPALLIVGDDDLLVEQARALRDRMEASGATLTYLEGRGMAHVYPFLPVPEARAALDLLERSITD